MIGEGQVRKEEKDTHLTKPNSQDRLSRILGRRRRHPLLDRLRKPNFALWKRPLLSHNTLCGPFYPSKETIESNPENAHSWLQVRDTTRLLWDSDQRHFRVSPRPITLSLRGLAPPLAWEGGRVKERDQSCLTTAEVTLRLPVRVGQRGRWLETLLLYWAVEPGRPRVRLLRLCVFCFHFLKWAAEGC